MFDFEAKVGEEIQKRANKNHTSAEINTVGVDRDVLFDVISELREEGYVVKLQKEKMDVFWYDEEPQNVSALI